MTIKNQSTIHEGPCLYGHGIHEEYVLNLKIDHSTLKKNLTDLEKYENNCSGAIIIGSGPAGLNAALYAARLGIKSPIVLAGPLPGGLLTTTGAVENWPGTLSMQGQDIIDAQTKQAIEAGAQIFNEKVIRIDTTEWPYRVVTDKRVYYGFTVIIASGSKIKKLGCKGEEDFWGKGLSTCAICDAPAHKNKTVIVVGGGDSACEEALQLIPHVDHVYICVRKDHMRASMAMQNKIKENSKITVLYNIELKEIKGTKESITDALLVQNNENAIMFSEINKYAPLSGIFLAIGHVPNTDFIPQINLNEHGLIITKNQRTSIEGIFAAGDVCNLYRQACVASAEGCIAALEAFKCLEKHLVTQEFNTQYNYLWIKKNNCSNGICPIPKTSQSSISGVTINTAPPAELSNVGKKDNDVIILKKSPEFEALSKQHKNEFYVVQIATAYCPPCKAMKKTLKEYKASRKNTIASYIIEIENMPILSQRFSLKGFPTLLLFYGERLISKKTGSMSLEQFYSWIEQERKKNK